MRVLKPAALVAVADALDADADADADAADALDAALADAERRLVAEMLCLEHAARAVGPDLQPLPAPHAPWPVLELPPVTARGAPSTVHYRPTVGVVYYTLPPGGRVAELAVRVTALLERAGDAHLRGSRAAAATPTTVLRHKGRVAGGTVLAGSRKSFKKAIAKKEGLPARIVLWTPPDALEPPPHYSVRAAFTWVFMPVTAAIAIGEARSFDSMQSVNATLSAVFYDGGGVSNLPDGGDAATLSIASFDAARLPPFLTPPGGRHPTRGSLLADGGLLLDGGGRLTFVGRLANLHLKSGSTWPPGRSLRQLPETPWDPDTILASREGCVGAAGAECRSFQCVSCLAPLGGPAPGAPVAVIRQARAPELSAHREWYYNSVAPKCLLTASQVGLLLCAFCWDAFEAPRVCLTAHMNASISRTAYPYTQAETAAACAQYAPLAPLLAGTAAPLAGAGGAFVVKTAEDGPGAGASVVLAGDCLGRYPFITNPAISALKLGVVAGLPLVEVRRADA